MEAVCDGIATTRFLMQYNYRRGMQSIYPLNSSMNTITIPATNWFQYQMWLNQNYMYPTTDYTMLPVSIDSVDLTFIRESDLNRFIERWEHTLR